MPNPTSSALENFEDLKLNFDKFIQNLSNFNPGELVLEKLTYEVFNRKLKESFNF